MCTTRSPIRRAPATEPCSSSAGLAYRPARSHDVAVLLVGQGSTRSSRPDELLDRHAAALAERGRFAEVGAATIAGRPTPREALARIRSRDVVIVPLLMCDGVLYREALPPALKEEAGSETHHLRLCRPLGVHPLVADLVLRRAMQAISERGLTAAATTLLLIGHGSSRDPASEATLALQAERVRRASIFGSVEMAFIGQPPFLADVLANGQDSLIGIALFAARGNHVVEDIEKLFVVNASKNKSAWFLGAVGEDQQLVPIIERIASEALEY